MTQQLRKLYCITTVCIALHYNFYTLSGRIGMVVASHAAVARSSPAEVALIYTLHEALREHCP